MEMSTPQGTAAETSRRFLTPAEVAADLRVSGKTLSYWRAVNIGPPSVKIGSQVRYPEADFRAWLAVQIESTRRGDDAPGRGGKAG